MRYMKGPQDPGEDSGDESSGGISIQQGGISVAAGTAVRARELRGLKYVMCVGVGKQQREK
jgi:hypothetical protein